MGAFIRKDIHNKKEEFIRGGVYLLNKREFIILCIITTKASLGFGH